MKQKKKRERDQIPRNSTTELRKRCIEFLPPSELESKPEKMNGTDSGDRQREKEKEAGVFEFRHRQVKNGDQRNKCAMLSHCAIALLCYA